MSADTTGVSQGNGEKSPRSSHAESKSTQDLQKIALERTWHYGHDLGGGVATRTNGTWANFWHDLRRNLFDEVLHAEFGPSLAGTTCLDAACNSGYWSFLLAEKGADRITAFDWEPQHIADAELVRACHPERPEYQKITFAVGSLQAPPANDGPYDLVLAMGIMYHLTDIFGAARTLYNLAKGVVLIDSSVSALRGPVLEIPDPSRYFWISPGEFSFVPTREALVAILRQVGFTRVDIRTFQPDHPAYPYYGDQGFRVLIVAAK